jgi:RimJ/RimL family protein N-acetyltransferase
MLANNKDVDVLGPWAWKLMGSGQWWGPEGKSALGHIKDGEILWAAVYDHYEKGGSIQVHIAIDDPKVVTRRAISQVFEYPFNQLGVKKLIGIVNSENIKALAFDLRLGFQIEHVIYDAYDMGDMYILTMTPDQCRWIRGKDYGQLNKRSAAA